MRPYFLFRLQKMPHRTTKAVLTALREQQKEQKEQKEQTDMKITKSGTQQTIQLPETYDSQQMNPDYDSDLDSDSEYIQRDVSSTSHSSDYNTDAEDEMSVDGMSDSD